MNAIKPLSMALALSLTVTSIAPVAVAGSTDPSIASLSSALRTRVISEQAKVEIERHEGLLRVVGGEDGAYHHLLERYGIWKREKHIKLAPAAEQHALRALDARSLRSNALLASQTNSDQGSLTFLTSGLDLSAIASNNRINGAGIVREAPLMPVKISLVDSKLAAGNDWLYSTDSFLTPATKAESLNFLKHPLDALARRIELLTGKRYSRKEILELSHGRLKQDFTNLPKFDRILISSLEITKDNLGKVLVESLKEHVRRNNTAVRILVSQAFYDGVDHQTPGQGLASIDYLRSVEAQTNGKIAVQLYKFDEPDYEGYEAKSIHDLHRVQHAKMMLLINTQQPGKSRAIIGGRNMSNNYFFMKTSEFSPTTSMHPYNESTYASYADLEVEIAGATLINDIATQFNALWNRDLLDQRFQAPFQHFAIDGAGELSLGEGKIVRHFLSLPFVNGGESRGIERLFVQLIDSAKSDIKITTPYFHPTPAIVAALHRAMNDRKVPVTIVTNIDFSKDGLLPSAVQAANRAGIISVGNQANFRLWRTDDVSTMIHAKTMAIDDDTLYIGSANMNHRSFTHDVENGLLIRDKAIVSEYKQNFDEFFVKNSIKTTVQKVREAYSSSMLLSIIKDIF